MGPESQELFAFEWEYPTCNTKQQFAGWCFLRDLTILPTLSGEILARDLRELQLAGRKLSQYVYDIRIASPDEEASDKNAILPLNFLAEMLYKVSPTKRLKYPGPM